MKSADVGGVSSDFHSDGSLPLSAVSQRCVKQPARVGHLVKLKQLHYSKFTQLFLVERV